MVPRQWMPVYFNYTLNLIFNCTYHRPSPTHRTSCIATVSLPYDQKTVSLDPVQESPGSAERVGPMHPGQTESHSTLSFRLFFFFLSPSSVPQIFLLSQPPPSKIKTHKSHSPKFASLPPLPLFLPSSIYQWAPQPSSFIRRFSVSPPSSSSSLPSAPPGPMTPVPWLSCLRH